MPASSLRRSPSIRECSSEGFVTRGVAQTDTTAPEAAENLSSLGKDPLHFPRP